MSGCPSTEIRTVLRPSARPCVPPARGRPLAAPVPRYDRPMLCHDVYFTLRDASDAAIAKLVTACETYLRDHPGVEWFSVGGLEPELDREVNDRAFHVALHVTFTDRASHDAYQVAPEHDRFIAENQDNWAQVRVFDSVVAGGAGRS